MEKANTADLIEDILFFSYSHTKLWGSIPGPNAKLEFGGYIADFNDWFGQAAGIDLKK